MRSSSGRISIAASAQKLDVDNRISLRYYCRIADNILKQADIFREENNIIDLYVMLLRFSSLVTETIPCHRDYRASLQGTKISLKKKLLNALSELEQLKPAVEKKINELDRKYAYQLNGFGHNHQNSSVNLSLEFSPAKSQSLNSYAATTIPRPVNQEYLYQGPRTRRISYSKPLEEPFRRFSLTIPQANEETLSRHSILGPTGLSGSWQPPIINKRVQYPSNIDFTPVEIPRENSIQQPVEDRLLSGKDSSSTEHKYEGSRLESIHAPDKNNQILRTEEPVSLISFETIESPPEIKIIRQPSPPPVLAEVQDLVPTTSAAVADGEIVMENPSHAGLVCSEAPLQLHISTALMDSFMRLAKSNTDNNLETCGVLAGSLKNRTFFVTALIIPKQESTSDSCQTTNEEEIFEVQDKQSLFPLGWIHTHPTQSCFMSSIDVHTHYSYQIMLPEAIAIVMAPRDSSRTHGIFRLTTPGGMTVIRQCPRRGFHSHDPPPDGSPIYRQCTDVYMDSNLKFDVVDLR